MAIKMRMPVRVTGVTLDKSSITLTTAGDTEQLTATISPSNAEDTAVNWSSSDTTVATVSSTGLVTCVTPGTATITVTTHDGGYTATCGVTNQQSRQPGANTVAYYKLETDANDYSGNGYNGTGTGVSYTTVGGVQCAYFDNNVSHKIQIPGLGTFTDLTMVIWAKTSVSLASVSCLFSLAPSTDNKNIAIQGNGGTTTLSRRNGNSALDISGGTLNDDVWHCIIGTFNSSTGSKLYVDGVYKGDNTTASQVRSDTGYSGIGGHPANSQSIFKYGGYLSNAIAENKVWTAQEVSDYYDLMKGNYGIS